MADKKVDDTRKKEVAEGERDVIMGKSTGEIKMGAAASYD